MKKIETQPKTTERQKTMIEATMDQIKAAFAEWDRRYREDPESFQNEASHILKETPETYGDFCGPYFAKILAEGQKDNTEVEPPVCPYCGVEMKIHNVKSARKFYCDAPGCEVSLIGPTRGTIQEAADAVRLPVGVYRWGKDLTVTISSQEG